MCACDLLKLQWCQVGCATDYAYLTVHDSEPVSKNKYGMFAGFIASLGYYTVKLRDFRFEGDQDGLGRHGVDKPSAV